MRKRLALSDGRLVVNLPNPSYESIIEGHLPEGYAPLFGLPRSIPRIRTNLIHPPVLESRYRQGCKVIPLHGVGIFWRGFGQSLYKSEQIDASLGLAQIEKHRFWIVQKK